MKRSVHEVSGHESPNPKKIKQWSVSDYLVEDTLRLILSKIDLKCKRRARLGCKQWFDIINLSEFNIGALRRDELPSVVSVLSRYDKPNSIRFKNLSRVNPDDLVHLTKLHSIVEFSGKIPDRREDFLSALTDLRSLTINKISTDIFTVLKNLTKLDCKELLGTLTVPVTQLRELLIHDPRSLQVSVNNFPNLKRLKADFDGDCYLTSLEYLHLQQRYSCNGLPVTLTELVADRGLNFNDLTKLTRLKTLPCTFSTTEKVSNYFPFLERWSAGTVRRSDEIFWSYMSQLSHLTSLSIHMIHSPLYGHISLLTGLFELKLRFTLSWTVDVSFFSSLSKLTKLEILQAIDYGCKNCTSLTALENLQSLKLKCVNVAESFANSMTNLTSLKFSLLDTKIDEPKYCFTKLTNLLELNLESSAVSPTTVSDRFGDLTHLTSLTVNSIDNEDWCEILKLTNLRRYSEYSYLGSNKDRLADLTVMKKLTYLGVLGNTYTNPYHLTLLTSLQSLFNCGFLSSGVSEVELEELVAKLPYCKLTSGSMKGVFLTRTKLINFIDAQNK